jgi:hypothetical protein
MIDRFGRTLEVGDLVAHTSSKDEPMYHGIITKLFKREIRIDGMYNRRNGDNVIKLPKNYNKQE